MALRPGDVPGFSAEFDGTMPGQFHEDKRTTIRPSHGTVSLVRYVQHDHFGEDQFTQRDGRGHSGSSEFLLPEQIRQFVTERQLQLPS